MQQTNQKQNKIPYNKRFVLKLEGEIDNNFLTIDSETSLSISKEQIDKIDRVAQISQWKFKVGKIFLPENSLKEIYTKEIEETDFISSFTTTQTYRNIIFVGSNEDSLMQKPFNTFINSFISTLPFPLEDDNFIYLGSNYIITKNKLYNNTNGQIISNPKIINYPDETRIIDQQDVSLSSREQFEKFIKFDSGFRDELLEHNTEIISFRVWDKKNQKVFSKINFVMYKGYNIDNEFGNFTINTKENYQFFNSVHQTLNPRCSYVMKYLYDVFQFSQEEVGKNLFIFLLPCQINYLILLHDMLNYIEMRRYIVQNYYCENGEPINDMTFLTKDVSGIKLNNSILTQNNFETEDSKNENSLNETRNTGAESFLSSTIKKERRQFNVERLKAIQNKKQVMKFFDFLDKNSKNF